MSSQKHLPQKQMDTCIGILKNVLNSVLLLALLAVKTPPPSPKPPDVKVS